MQTHLVAFKKGMHQEIPSVSWLLYSDPVNILQRLIPFKNCTQPKENIYLLAWIQ